MPIHFYSKSAEYGWLSNFSAHGFKFGGVRWSSVEHYYQAMKFQGTDLEERIRIAETPLKARKLGQDRSLTPRADWESAREAVMAAAIEAKFRQNGRLLRQLLDTGAEELIHDSSSDLYWGRTTDGCGENRLGEIIMGVRTKLREAA